MPESLNASLICQYKVTSCVMEFFLNVFKVKPDDALPHDDDDDCFVDESEERS